MKKKREIYELWQQSRQSHNTLSCCSLPGTTQMINSYTIQSLDGRMRFFTYKHTVSIRNPHPGFVEHVSSLAFTTAQKHSPTPDGAFSSSYAHPPASWRHSRNHAFYEWSFMELSLQIQAVVGIKLSELRWKQHSAGNGFNRSGLWSGFVIDPKSCAACVCLNICYPEINTF